MAAARFASIALSVAALFAVPASAAFDAEKCQDFITGTWSAKPGDGAAASQTTYSPDGTYRQGADTAAAGEGQDTVESGSWTALKAASGKGCDLSLTPTGGTQRAFQLTVMDDDTVKADDGTVFTRVAEEDTQEGPAN
jgi:hypothetical protein